MLFRSSDFRYYFSTSSSSSSEITNISFLRNAQFYTLNYGVLINLYTNFYLSFLLSYNQLFYQTDIYNGYQVSEGISNKMTGQRYHDSTSYNNTKFILRNTHSFASFIPKLSYAFRIKNKTVSVFTSGNLAFAYKAPWWVIGIQYYPFRKL